MEIGRGAEFARVFTAYLTALAARTDARLLHELLDAVSGSRSAMIDPAPILDASVHSRTNLSATKPARHFDGHLRTQLPDILG